VSVTATVSGTATAAATTYRVILVPWSAVTADNARETFTVRLTADQVQSAPGFAASDWPDTTSAGWDGTFAGFWQGVGAAPSGTSTATAGTASGQGTSTTGTGTATLPPAGALYLNSRSIIGMAVKDTSGNQLAGVSDLLGDPAAGTVRYVVVSFGGFLGLGAQSVAVPWNAMVYDSGGQNFILNADQQALSNAPGFDANAAANGDANWDANVQAYWQSRGLPTQGGPSGAPGPGTSGAGPGSTGGVGAATGATPAAGAATGGAAAGNATIGRPLVQISRLSGWTVKASNGTNVGEVSSLMVAIGSASSATATPASSTTGATAVATATAEATGATGGAAASGAAAGTGSAASASSSGHIAYVVVGYGGIFGIGQTTVPVPWSLFTVDEQNRTFNMAADEQTFKQAPTIDVKALPKTPGTDWDTPIREYWSGRVAPSGAGTGGAAAGGAAATSTATP
jgi:sporulation protein YlmC with PRC-barrel domain